MNSFFIIITVVTGIVFFLVVGYFVHLGKADPNSSLPLPKGSIGWPILGETIPFIRDPLRFYAEHFNKYGHVFKTHIFFKPTIGIYSPDVLRELFIKNQKYLEGLPLAGTATPLLGKKSVMVLVGAEHKCMRHVLLHAFTPTQLALYLPRTRSIMEDYIRKWFENGVFDAATECKAQSAHIGQALFLGVDEKSGSRQKLQGLCEAIVAGFFCLPYNIPGTQFSKAIKARNTLLKVVEETLSPMIVQVQHGRGNEIPASAMKLLIEGHREKPLSMEELKHSAVSLLIAGIQTTSSAFFEIIVQLCHNRKVAKTIRKEIRNVLNDDEVITLEHLNQMTYLDQALWECFRMTNTPLVNTRKVLKTLEVGGIQIPKGWQVIFNFPPILHDSGCFSKPDRFVPDRIKSERGNFKKYVIPYGLGDRQCIGKNFAQMERKLFAVLLLRNHKLKFVEGPPTQASPGNFKVRISKARR